jgi:4-alpha-glucanotransferase
MNLNFHIEYQTVYGQDLILNIVSEKKKGAPKVSEYRMQTVDGVHWDCQVSCVIGTGTSVDYFYSIENGGRKERREWGVVAHRLEATCENGQIYDIYDHWIDIPEDSYLYTSAITDCVVGKKIEQPRITPFAKTVRLQVRAPQLSHGMALYVTGGEVAMGEWDDSKAIRMTEHNINEWLADIDAGELADSLIDFKFFAKDDATGNIVWEYSNNRSVQLPDLADGQVVVYDLSQAFFPLPPVRCAGTLVPVFSLRSRESFGVGDFGDLKKMIDWVAKTKQRVLQILPINDTTITHTWTDSYPYSCISIFALHPQYADLNQLPKIADKALADETWSDMWKYGRPQQHYRFDPHPVLPPEAPQPVTESAETTTNDCALWSLEAIYLQEVIPQD